MLKTELHTHVNDDPKDHQLITYSARELVEGALSQKFAVLAITCHNFLYQNEELKKYAKGKGLLLIFGVEKDIESKHVLLYGLTPEEAGRINTFKDLHTARQKNKNLFTIAAHPPYFGASCLGNKIYQFPELFDAWEHSFLHTTFYNPNKKMLEKAKQMQKPVVGNSDVHFLKDLGRTYTLIDLEKNNLEKVGISFEKRAADTENKHLNESDIFLAIKENKVKLVTQPLSCLEFLRIIGRAFWSGLRHKWKNR